MSKESIAVRKARKLDVFRDNLNNPALTEVADWFDEADDLEINEEELDSLQIRIVEFHNRNRLGIFYGEKSFAFPLEMREVPVVEKVLEDLKLRATVESSSELKTPRLVSSTTDLIKKLEGMGYGVISPTITAMLKTYSPKQISLLTKYLYSHLLRTKGIERLDLRLKTNTEYFRNKAKKLANLQNGVGNWSLSTIEYHGNDIAYCTMGHKLKWEFIVEEETTGERISFGAYCVEDFFEVDGEVRGKIASHKTALSNALIEYAVQLASSSTYAYHIDAWVSAYTTDAIQASPAFGKVHAQYLEFVKNRVLVPQELSNELISAYPFDYYKHVNNQLFSLLDAEYRAVSLLGVFGNQLISPEDFTKGGSFSKVHQSGTLNLYGLIMKNDGKVREALHKFGADFLPNRWITYLPKAVSTLRAIKSYEDYFNIANNIANLQRSLTLLDVGQGIKFNISLGKVTSIVYKGVTIQTDGIPTKDLVSYLSGTEFDLFSPTPMPKLGLNFSNFPDGKVKTTLMEVRKLFLDKHTINGRVEVRALKRYKPDSPMGRLVQKGYSSPLTSAVLRSHSVGSLRDTVLKAWLEAKLGIQAEDLAPQAVPTTPKTGFVIDEEGGLVPWSDSGTSKQTLALISKAFSELAIEHTSLVFPNKVLTTALSYGRLTEKQLVHVKRGVETLQKVISDKLSKGEELSKVLSKVQTVL